MSQFKKLLQRVINNPKTVKFEELDKILIKEGFIRRQAAKGSSHFIYTKEGKFLTVPYHKPYIKQIYVERAMKIMDWEGAEDE